VQEKSDAELAVNYNLEEDEDATETSPIPAPPMLPAQTQGGNYIVGDEADKSPEVLPKEKVDQIVVEYRNALESSVITPDILEGMKDVRNKIRKKIAKAEASFTVKQQPLKYTPNPEKTCIRSRYNHTPSELQHQIEIVEKSVDNELTKLGVDNNEKALTQDQAEECNMLLEDRRLSLPKQARRAIAAAELLVDDIAKAYYEPVQNNQVDQVLDKLSKTPSAQETKMIAQDYDTVNKVVDQDLSDQDSEETPTELGSGVDDLVESYDNASFDQSLDEDGDGDGRKQELDEVDDEVPADKLALDDDDEGAKTPTDVLSSASEYEEAYDEIEIGSEGNDKVTLSDEIRKDSWFISKIKKLTLEDFDNIAWDAEAKFQ